MAEEFNDDELQFVNGGAFTGKAITYVVKRGDTLSKIAQKYHTSVRSLMQMNNIKIDSRIAVGDKIRIPTY